MDPKEEALRALARSQTRYKEAAVARVENARAAKALGATTMEIAVRMGLSESGARKLIGKVVSDD